MNFKGAIAKVRGNSIKYGKQFVGAMQKNSPTILSALAILGFAGSMYTLWKTKDKIEDDLEQRRLDIRDANDDFEDEEENKREIKMINRTCAKNVAIHALPVAVMSTATVAAIIASVKIGNRRYAALSAAYTLLDQNSKEWREKARELLGEGKLRKVDEAYADEKIGATYPDDDDQILTTGHGDTIFYDSWTDRYFKSAIEYIRRQVNDLNYRLMSEDWLDLNEFYYAVGLGPCKAGHEFGWNIGYNGQIEIKMIPRIVERNGVERTVIYLEYNAFLRERYC